MKRKPSANWIRLNCWGVLANQTEEVIGLLTQFAHHYGLAFQIRDDLLDATSTEADLGKK